jgi:hypothetical protein
LEGNFNFSSFQIENDDHNEFKCEFKEPPLDVENNFIQYNHNKKFAADSQISQPTYTKPQKECFHWMNRSNHHITSYSHEVDFLYESHFNEEYILQESKEGHSQQEDPWVICFIYEDNEIVYETKNTTLHFSTNVQQQFIFVMKEHRQQAHVDKQISALACL